MMLHIRRQLFYRTQLSTSNASFFQNLVSTSAVSSPPSQQLRSFSFFRDLVSSIKASAFPSSSSPPRTASVPFLISRENKARLSSDLDWSPAEVRTMTPVVAKVLLDNTIARPERLKPFKRLEIEALVAAVAIEQEEEVSSSKSDRG